MAIPRHLLVDADTPYCYHIVSRCVRRSWLCGFDRSTRRDYTHRKTWLLERLKLLGGAFSVDVYAYAIMSNHFHLVLYYDPKADEQWTDFDVAERWLSVCPPKKPDGSVDFATRELQRQAILSDPNLLTALRRKLCSLSVFMKLLKQPIARRANLEDECQGHFFEQRFYSCALLTEQAVIAAMAYVDLNPVRAKIAKTITENRHTSIHARLGNNFEPNQLNEYLAPLVTGAGDLTPIRITLGDYIDHLEVVLPTTKPSWQPDKLDRWRAQVATLKQRPRALGSVDILQEWCKRRGWSPRELTLFG
ncbi:MAG: hypothetical protein GKR90_01755 [Pseudomonadales bacterium]|nr:hypothetical protein [Pseudomonadales bacterium]